MYLWVLGPIHLFYLHRHGRGYIRMSPLFKTKMVTTGELLGAWGPHRAGGGRKGGAGRTVWSRAENPE